MEYNNFQLKLKFKLKLNDYPLNDYATYLMSYLIELHTMWHWLIFLPVVNTNNVLSHKPLFLSSLVMFAMASSIMVTMPIHLSRINIDRFYQIITLKHLN